MLEEKNDNLSVNENETDGNVNNEFQEAVQTENQEVEAIAEAVETEVELIPDTEVEAPLVAEAEQETVLEVEDLVGEQITETPKEVPTIENTAEDVVENVIELTDEQVADDSIVLEDANDFAMNAIANANAEESEDETLKERHDIPLLDYEALDMETLVNELKQLVTTEKVMSIKEHVEEIKKAFLAKYLSYPH